MEEDDGEATDTAAVPMTPVAKESTPSPLPQPEPVPLHPDTSITKVPTENVNPARPMETQPAPTAASATSTVPTQQEELPKPQDAVRPKTAPVRRGMPEEDGEEAGPSGLNSHPSTSSSSSSAPSAPFIPFSGGGQRLGGPSGGAVGHTLSSSSSSSSLSAHTATVESPKAKKAKSSYNAGSKVRHISSLKTVKCFQIILFLRKQSQHIKQSVCPDVKRSIF